MATAAADDGAAPLAGQSAAAATTEDAPRHHPDTWRNVLIYVAAAGHTREAARATLATPDLRHDPELLSRIVHVATREKRCYEWCPPGCFPKPGLTLLDNAVKRDNTARAAELLAACPTPAFRRELLEHHEALHRGGRRFGRSAAMVRCLLDAGANPAAVGAADIQSIVSAGNTAVLAELLPALGSAEERRELVRNQLVWATSGAMAQLLLDNGADVHAVNNERWGGSDAFYFAAQGDSPEVMDVLLAALGSAEARRETINRVDADGHTLLMTVQRRNSDEVALQLMARLIAAGADVNLTDRGGHDAVWHEVFWDKSVRISTLLAALGSDDARWASVNRADAHGRTPLMYARSPAVAQALLDAGADVNAVVAPGRNEDEQGRTPLMYACSPLMYACSLAVAQALLAAGADVSAIDSEGHDAVWHAAAQGDDEAKGLVSTLLVALGSDDARRASWNQKDEQARSLLTRACKYNSDGAQALLVAGADVNSDAVLYAAQNERRGGNLVSTLLAALGSDDARRAAANVTDEFGCTPLMHACERSYAVARLLLSAGADVNAVDNEGHDAVWYAAEDRRRRDKPEHDDLVFVLLAALGSDDARRASLDRVDARGRTILMDVISSEAIIALLAAGVDLQRLDWAARTEAALDDDDYYDAWAWTFPDVLMALDPEARHQQLRANSCQFLRLAQRYGHDCTTLKRLLDMGADVRAVDAAGHDIFWHVAQKRYGSSGFCLLLDALGSVEERRRVMQRPDVVAAGLDREYTASRDS